MRPVSLASIGIQGEELGSLRHQAPTISGLTAAMKQVIFIFAICFLSACAAVGVTASSDPHQKLKDAYSLLRGNRPYPAERLMREAIAGFEERKDSYGLGVAQFMYGQFVKSHGFDWPLFRKLYPNTDTAEQRNALASRYFMDAIGNFRTAAADPNLTHDTRTGYYWREYLAHREMNNREGMCATLHEMETEHDALIKESPGAKVQFPEQYATFDEYITASLRDAQCDHR
jgi:hypothetical protein